jgi:hypothetical protein
MSTARSPTTPRTEQSVSKNFGAKRRISAFGTFLGDFVAVHDFVCYGIQRAGLDACAHDIKVLIPKARRSPSAIWLRVAWRVERNRTCGL